MIEDIILRHSGRGMDLLRPHLAPDFCRRAAERLLSLPRGAVLLVTGFCVGSFTETDGPAGTLSLADALAALGFTPVVVTDAYCRGVFEPEQVAVEYFPLDGGDAQAQEILDRLQPVAIISLERCGVNADGDYANMRGVSIRSFTAPIDCLFPLAKGRCLTIGIGDGGNEIGMGNVADVIRRELPIVPCIVEADELLIATVSNWGGYGLCACMEQMTGLPLTPTFERMHAFMAKAAGLGCIDGVTRLPELTEDGFSEEITREILSALKREAMM